MYPEDYYNMEPKKAEIEPTSIPNWVPILLGIAIVGAFIVALYSLSIHKNVIYEGD
jgi:hypothetical protein